MSGRKYGEELQFVSSGYNIAITIMILQHLVLPGLAYIELSQQIHLQMEIGLM